MIILMNCLLKNLKLFVATGIEILSEKIENITKLYKKLNNLKVNKMNNQKLSFKAQQVVNFVNNTGGKIFSVKFKRVNPKIDKTTGKIDYFAQMECRTGVTKHLKGGNSTISHKKELISVYSVNSVRNGYRCFNADMVESITFRGTVYSFEANIKK